MRGTLIVSLALIAVTMAGCAKEGGAATEGTNAAVRLVEAPEWVLGKHWDYKTTGGTAGSGAISLVVSGESGGDWIIDTNDATTAYVDAWLDISYIGKIRKSDLAGAQGSDRIKFFDFPLELNKTWTTTWDGVTQTVNVQHVMDNGNAHLMAHDGEGRMTAEYEYSAAAGFFQSLTFYDANGTEIYKIEHTGHGLDYAGDALRYELLDPIVVEVDPLSTVQQTTPFSGANEIRLVLHAFCNGDTAGRVLIGLGPKPDDETVHLPPIPSVMEPEYGLNHDCSTGDVMVDDVGVIKIDDGESWNIDAVSASQTAQGLILIQPRNLVTVPGPFA